MNFLFKNHTIINVTISSLMSGCIKSIKSKQRVKVCWPMGHAISHVSNNDKQFRKNEYLKNLQMETILTEMLKVY